MKVTFIYPDLIGSANYGGIFYVGIASLSAILKKQGYRTSLIHVTQPVSKSEFLRRVDKEEADVYAFSCTMQMFGFVKNWSKWIKDKDSNKLVIVGGVHPTLYPEEVAEVDSIDLVCVGEGEYALLDLCRAVSAKKDFSSIPNLWGKQRGKLFKNRPRPLISDLDTLPFPDRTIYNYRNLMEGREDMLFFMASRGCPYNCPYCSNHSQRKVYDENAPWVRFRSVDNIISEIKSVLQVYPNTKYIGFYDDILALRKDWFKEFSRQCKENIRLPFRCNMRADYMAKEDIVKMMHDAGCRRVIVGLESGNEYVRNTVLKRNMSEDILFCAGKLCKNYGIELATYNMVGLPDENFRAILDTVKLNAKIKADFNYASIYYPFPKTGLYELCKQKDLLTDRVVTDYVESSALAFSKLHRIRLLFVRNYFRFLVNTYKFIYVMPSSFRPWCEKVFDSLLSIRVIAFTLFAFANWFFKMVRENRILAAFINRFKQRFKRKKIAYFAASFSGDN